MAATASEHVTVMPPESFTQEQQLCYWAYDVFVRTQIEQRGLTPEEAAAYSYLYRITTLVDNGQPVNARERALYDTYLQVMEIYEALHSGGAVFGEPRFDWLKGRSKTREVDHTWRITKFTSHVPLPEWRDIPNVAPPVAPLRCPRHRLPPPPGWPDSEEVGYLPPEAAAGETRAERRARAKEDREAAERARGRVEERARYLEKEAAREAEEAEERRRKEAAEAEKRAQRREAAARRRRDMAADPEEAAEDPEEAARKEREVLRREREEAHAREKERRRRLTGFITTVDPKDGKLKEDERLKELVNLAYQEIGEPYQLQRFRGMLPRLNSVKILVLSHNMLSDLSFASFPNLEKLVVSGNDFWSLEKLPSCPELVTLDVADNNIWSLRGLKKFKKVIELDLRDNPITAENDYRQRVVKASPPSLTWLDDAKLDREKELPEGFKFDSETSNRKLDKACAIQ